MSKKKKTEKDMPGKNTLTLNVIFSRDRSRDRVDFCETVALGGTDVLELALDVSGQPRRGGTAAEREPVEFGRLERVEPLVHLHDEVGDASDRVYAFALDEVGRLLGVEFAHEHHFRADRAPEHEERVTAHHVEERDRLSSSALSSESVSLQLCHRGEV